MAEEAAYHRDPYRSEMDVWVDALGTDERFGQYLILSDTICHPHGGGQKGDRARLLLDAETAGVLGSGEALPLLDTRRDKRGTLHILGTPLAEDKAHEALVGAREFRLSLDWDFRYRQMRLHSLAHLLHCFVERVLEREVPYPETSDLQPDFGLNRYEIRELLSEAQVEAAVWQLNAFTAEGHPIRTFPDAEKEGYRYWQCGEWTIPCGGTHLRDTEEIGNARAALSLKRGRTSLTFSLAE
jgi:Ser-tRNA(Ala) deacylase AlaX